MVAVHHGGALEFASNELKNDPDVLAACAYVSESDY